MARSPLPWSLKVLKIVFVNNPRIRRIVHLLWCYIRCLRSNHMRMLLKLVLSVRPHFRRFIFCMQLTNESPVGVLQLQVFYLRRVVVLCWADLLSCNTTKAVRHTCGKSVYILIFRYMPYIYGIRKYTAISVYNVCLKAIFFYLRHVWFKLIFQGVHGEISSSSF